MKLRSRIVGSIGSIPTIFRLVRFAASVAFELSSCVGVFLAVVFASVLPFVALQFTAFSFEMAKLNALETVPFFGVLSSIFGRLGFSLGLGRFNLI